MEKSPVTFCPLQMQRGERSCCNIMGQSLVELANSSKWVIADALPGVGIVAAVLGIINTMSNLEDPESVGYKVAAALSGTFLGIFLAYGVGIPLGRLVSLNQTQEFLYYHFG